MKNIIDTAVATQDVSTLVTAIKAAGLVDTLSGDKQFTVFAPNDAAFKKIPADTLTALLADKNKLTALLKGHEVSGKILSKDLATMTEIPTLEGKILTINTKNGVLVDDAIVVKADIECSNGVIHVIDTVLKS